MVADSPLIPAAYAAMPTVPPRASMTRREFLYLRTADMVTTWALVRYLGPTMWTGAGLGAVLVAALFVAGVAPRVIVVAVLGVAFILAVATIAILLRRFHRGQLPPPGVYRIGFGPRRRWDGTGWIDG